MRGRKGGLRAIPVYSVVAGGLALAAVPSTALQGQTPALPETQTLGPQVGARLPDFTLPDQHGQWATTRAWMPRWRARARRRSRR
jgi:hypothetical protein